MLCPRYGLIFDSVNKKLQPVLIPSVSHVRFITGLCFFLQTTILADKHEMEAADVTEKANEILNKSKQALNATEHAMNAQKKTTDGIEELLKKLNRTIDLYEKAKSEVERSREEAQDAMDEAMELYENGTAPLPDLGLSEMQGMLESISSDDVQSENKMNIKKLDG